MRSDQIRVTLSCQLIKKQQINCNDSPLIPRGLSFYIIDHHATLEEKLWDIPEYAAHSKL